MDPNTAEVYIKIGEEIYPIIRGAITDVLAFIRSGSAENVDVDNAKLDELHQDSLRRIAQAEQEAGDPSPAA